MRRSLLVLILSLATAGWTRAAAPTGIVPPNAPKSAFVSEPGFGKDPFFPNSVRFQKTVTADPEPRAAVPEFLSLKGISIVAGRKLAILNNSTVAEGEEVSLRYGNQLAKVKCMEIKERLVIIQVNGVTKELSLRAGVN